MTTISYAIAVERSKRTPGFVVQTDRQEFELLPGDAEVIADALRQASREEADLGDHAPDKDASLDFHARAHRLRELASTVRSLV